MMRVLIAFCTLMFATAGHTLADEKIPLKVLYAGKSDDNRTEDYRVFLSAHFQTVTIRDYLTLKPEDACECDVVLLDWPDAPPRDMAAGRFLFRTWAPIIPSRRS